MGRGFVGGFLFHPSLPQTVYASFAKSAKSSFALKSCLTNWIKPPRNHLVGKQENGLSTNMTPFQVLDPSAIYFVQPFSSPRQVALHYTWSNAAKTHQEAQEAYRDILRFSWLNMLLNQNKGVQTGVSKRHSWSVSPMMDRGWYRIVLLDVLAINLHNMFVVTFLKPPGSCKFLAKVCIRQVYD